MDKQLAHSWAYTPLFIRSFSMHTANYPPTLPLFSASARIKAWTQKHVQLQRSGRYKRKKKQISMRSVKDRNEQAFALISATPYLTRVIVVERALLCSATQNIFIPNNCLWNIIFPFFFFIRIFGRKIFLHTIILAAKMSRHCRHFSFSFFFIYSRATEDIFEVFTRISGR